MQMLEIIVAVIHKPTIRKTDSKRIYLKLDLVI